MDTLTPAARSALMARVKSKDSKPEMVVRRLVHGLGYRYRLHAKSLPGSPDLVFAARRCVIFVHGCFWHGHACRKSRMMPASNGSFWREKLAGNVARDRRTARALRRAGWRVLTIWECETRLAKFARLTRRIVAFLERRAV